MIGGGGAGGYDRAGGGGAGSCIIAVSQTLGAGTYNIKVGKGQTAYNNAQNPAAIGFGYDSEIYLNTSILYRAKGGGMGGSAADNNANAGGCGGGAASQGPFNGGSATNLNYIAGNLVNANTITTTYANLGFKGGNQLVGWNGSNGDQLDGAGGGGIGAAGVDHNVGEINGTAGGTGLNQVSINGTPYNFQSYFANGGTFGDNGYIGGGGGGGNLAAGVNGNGGVGGGGSGGGSSALANTGGGGGGGAAGGGMGGNGGSGIVIARYRKSSIPTEIVVAGTTSIIIGATERYISFPYSGSGATKDYNFTTTENLLCDILIVGGGGAGGNSMGGGGGAGGIVYAINQTLSTGTYTVKVGRGGIGLTLTDATGQGTIGIDQDGGESSLMNSNGSSYISLTLGGVSQQLRGYGGGGGGIYYNPSFVNGRNGGSGGGCTESNNNGYVVNTAGSATQPNTYWNGTTYVVGGKAGRQNTTTAQDYQAGGGGGLGSLSTDYRNGNDGVAINITGTSQFYAAGGGAGQYIDTSTSAGLGGSGIGGNGRIWTGSAYAAVPRNVATSGVNGTGSGGGGAAYTQSPVSPAGNGGSGIVIIRYRRYHPYLLNNYAPLTAGVAVPYSDLCTTIVSSTGQTAYDNLPVVSYGGYNWLLQHNFGTTGRWSGLQLRNFTTGLTIFSNAQLTSQNYTSFPSATSQIYTDWAPGWSYGSAYGIGGFNNTTNNGPNNIYSNYNTLFQPYFTSLGYSSMSNPSTSSSMIMYIPSWAKQVCLVAADLFRENNAGSNTRKNSYWWSANGTTWTNLGIASWRGSINGGDQYGSNISQDPSSNADMMVFNVSTAGYLLILESGNTITSIAFVLLKP
jgi:hypothetical protein